MENRHSPRVVHHGERRFLGITWETRSPAAAQSGEQPGARPRVAGVRRRVGEPVRAVGVVDEQRQQASSSSRASAAGSGRSTPQACATSQPCTAISRAPAAASRSERQHPVGHGDRPGPGVPRPRGEQRAGAVAEPLDERRRVGPARTGHQVDVPDLGGLGEARRASRSCAASRARRSQSGRACGAVAVGAGHQRQRSRGCSRRRARAARPRRAGRTGARPPGADAVTTGLPSSAGSRSGRPNVANSLGPKNAPTCSTPSGPSVEHLQVERRGSAPSVAAHVEPERRLPVGPGRHHPHVVRAARALRVDEPADVLGALVPPGERRHLPDRVAGQHRDDRVDVLVPEGLHVAVQHLAAARRSARRRCPRTGCALASVGVRTLQGAVHRRPSWSRAPRPPRRPSSAARRAGSAPRAGGPAGAAARRRTRAGSLSRSATTASGSRRVDHASGTGSSQAISPSSTERVAGVGARGARARSGSGRRPRPSRAVRQTLVAIR